MFKLLFFVDAKVDKNNSYCKKKFLFVDREIPIL